MDIPQILVIDDLFGRTVPNSTNIQRANLCGQYLVQDITGDETSVESAQQIRTPVAEAFFFRGQNPSCSEIGTIVENDLNATLATIRSGWSDSERKFNWALVLLDLCFYTGKVTKESSSRYIGMPQGRDTDDDPATCFGLDILKAIQNETPDLPVVILSSMPRQEVSFQFTSRGALAFIPRDQGNPQILREHLERYGLIQDPNHKIVGRSKPLMLALREARRVAISNQNVLIRGEAGTGKELFAEYIHKSSSRRSKNFEVLSLPAMSFNLVEDALFGHVKGAFDGATGANKSRKGAFENANEGTLFLDEVGDTPLDVQPKLLRVIQNGEIQRLGTDDNSTVDVRIISATNIDIEGMVAAGEGFRQDLLDRLRIGGTILLPPLRNRKEDIKLLTEDFIKKAQETNPRALSRQIDPKALDKLMDYEWPGNIRELQQVIFEAVNRYPDVEFFVSSHINFSKAFVSQSSSNLLQIPQIATSGVENRQFASELDIKSLIDKLNTFEFDPSSPELVGGLPKLKTSFSLLLVRYLEVVLKANTQNRTVQNPEGEVRIQRSINIMVGEGASGKISGSKAADMIKSLLNPRDIVIKSLIDDPDHGILKEALLKAQSLRPSKKHEPNEND